MLVRICYWHDDCNRHCACKRYAQLEQSKMETIKQHYHSHITYMFKAIIVTPAGSDWTTDDVPRLILAVGFALVAIYYGWRSVRDNV